MCKCMPRIDLNSHLLPSDILRSPTERDGEPYTQPHMPVSASVAPISLAELIREYYAAKLDISIANPGRREAADLSFREFLRCIQRIALAMHIHKPERHDGVPSGVMTTVFEATKDDGRRSPERVYTPRTPRTPQSPRYQRRGNVLATSPTKTCKLTTTSVISRLLQTSRAIITCQLPVPSDTDHNHIEKAGEKENPSASSVTPVQRSECNPTRPPLSHKVRRHPISSGGPPTIRIVQRPIM